MYQTIHNLKKHLIRRLGNSHLSQKGQTAVFLILIIAIALVMYSASLNWSRLAQYKTLTTVGANTAAANMASMLASSGEQILQVTMGGQIQICKKTNFIVLLAAVIIAAIIVYVTVGYGIEVAGWVVAAAWAGLALSVAALAINLTVVEPGLTRLWNKMQQNLPLDGQVIEGAIQAGLQAVVSDQISVSDHFDADSDGLWVNNADGGSIAARKDITSRFGYYYTKRLQEITTITIPGIDEFATGLREFVYDNPYAKVGPVPGCSGITCQAPDNFGIFDPVCVGNTPRPYCDPCCMPHEQFLDPGDPVNGIPPSNPNPAYCTPEQVALCGSGDYPVSFYAYQYDPLRENFDNAFLSFREKLGIDDENARFNRNQANPNTPPPQTLAGAPNNVFRKPDSTGYYTAAVQTSLGIIGGTPDKRRGVFPFLWNMSALLPEQQFAIFASPPIPIIPKADSVIMMTADPNNCTVLTCPNKIVADPNQCALSEGFDAGTNRPKTDGFYWKPGADEYCSDTWPYNDCTSFPGNCTGGAFNGTVPTCGCEPSSAALWHDDNVDNLVYSLKLFLAWALPFLKTDSDALNKKFTDWYPDAASWIAPSCPMPNNCDAAGSIDVTCRYCNKSGEDGFLLVWRDMLGSWVDLIDTWLYKTSFANNNNWCLPTSATAAATFSQIEKNAIPSLQASTPIPTDRNGVNMPPIWGDLNDTVACLNFNAINTAKLTSCRTKCAATPTDYTGNADVCLNLPRSVIDLKNSSAPAFAAENAAYATAQRLQDCLSSTCRNASGTILAVCTGLPVSVSPNCTAWPGNSYYNAVKFERDRQFNFSNYCEPSGGPTTGFQNNLASALTAAANQDPVLIARRNELTQLRDQAVAARATFLNGGYVNLNAFLKPCSPGAQLGEGCADCPNGGPAAKLICARANFTGADKVSNIAIYGWQSKPVSGRGPTGTAPDSGYWHLVRVEAFAPKRCFGQCGTSTLPWVRTWTHWRGLNRIRCYGITDTDGMTIARVTRYDEDRDSPGALLANGQLLWKFRFTNPGLISTAVPAALADACKHPPEYDEGVSPSTRIALNGAFMLNNNPVKDLRVTFGCWGLVNSLLDRGVQTTTCSKYFYDPSINHFSLQFTTCDPAKVKIATDCAASGMCTGG